MPGILPLVEVGVNYICFIMANQGINWKNHYQSDYADFLPAEHRQILQECQADLSFGNGLSGVLTASLFFFPAYLNLQTEADNMDYYGLLSHSVTSGDWSELEECYAKELQHVREFMPQLLLDESGGRPSGEYARKVKALGKVFVENFTRYQDTVWPLDKPWLEKVAGQVPGLWGGEDIIGQWEKQTGIRFSAPAYRILLVSAMNTGPSANSLAFDTNTFSCWDDVSCLNYYRCFIPHEIGTHLLAPLTVALVTDRKLYYPSYIAMENLAQYLNVKVFHFADYDGSSDDGFYHYDYFRKLYADLDRKHPAAGVLKLFKLAVQQAIQDGISSDQR